MAHLASNFHATVPSTSRGLISRHIQPCHWFQRRKKPPGRVNCLCNYSPPPSSPVGSVREARKWGNEETQLEGPYGQVGDDYLVSVNGWGVRRLIENGDEMKNVARIQAEAFHVPVALFDDLFFEFFKAEVLAGLIYKLRNSPPDRYACIVAEPVGNDSLSRGELVGVVDVTVLRDQDVVRHLQGENEYLYISGIAVSQSYRRQKVGTALLEACDVLSSRLGYRYLVLRAYEDDYGARKLYSNAGYELVAGDPFWVTWVGKKRRVLMIKKI